MLCCVEEEVAELSIEIVEVNTKVVSPISNFVIFAGGKIRNMRSCGEPCECVKEGVM